MNDNHNYPLYNKADHTARARIFLTRREWLEKTGTALAPSPCPPCCLSRTEGSGRGGSPLAPKQPPRTPKAKRANIFSPVPFSGFVGSSARLNSNNGKKSATLSC